MLSLAGKHHCQPTPKLSKALRVRRSQTLSSGHHSKVGVSQARGKLMFQGLICLPQEFWFESYNFSYQYLQRINKYVLGLPGFLRPFIEIPYQGTDSLTRLKCETKMVYQSLRDRSLWRVKPR